VRQYLEKKYGSEQVHESGLRVYTTLDLDLQKAATKSVQEGLAAYIRRQGWQGHLQNVRELGATVESYRRPEWNYPIEPGTYIHVLVTSVSPGSASVRFGLYTATVDAAEVLWTKLSLRQLLSVGDIAWVKVLSLGPDFKARVQLAGESEAQGALLAIDNSTGDVKAMVGGRDFDKSKFNRATQALRQVGSSFKPYVYAAAIDEGASPEDTILDAPVTFTTASGRYTPHNYDLKFEGAITLRHALADSRNIPALLVANRVGIKKVIGYVHRFGIKRSIPAYLPIALGAVELTLLEHTSAFSAFPNDGVRMVPRYVVKVTDQDGRLLEENYSTAEDVLSERTARIMTSMLRDVVLHGTAAAASRMSYSLAGKTGTTNDFTDAWFIGFSPSITCGVWLGFDEKKSLGNKETGATAALPVWMKFMGAALATENVHNEFAPLPPTVQGQSTALFRGESSNVANSENVFSGIVR
jgi:penicillin-binding protein 1A